MKVRTALLNSTTRNRKKHFLTALSYARRKGHFLATLYHTGQPENATNTFCQGYPKSSKYKQKRIPEYYALKEPKTPPGPVFESVFALGKEPIFTVLHRNRKKHFLIALSHARLPENASQQKQKSRWDLFFALAKLK
jgi:hypothetical protein